MQNANDVRFYTILLSADLSTELNIYLRIRIISFPQATRHAEGHTHTRRVYIYSYNITHALAVSRFRYVLQLLRS